MKHLILLFLTILMVSCNIPSIPVQEPQSASGVTKAEAQVQTDASGLTIEQKNIQGNPSMRCCTIYRTISTKLHINITYHL